MNREQIIDKYFTNISLHQDYLDLYYVRSSLFRSVELTIPKFKGKILDVGCGIMPYREVILNRNKSVTSYIGLDFEDSIYPEYALGKPDLFWKGDVIPMEDNSVETVIATELFEHCPEPERVMKEILRVLKPGGMVFFTVPFLFYLHLVPHDEYRYTPYSLSRHLSNAGFSNIELRSLGGWDASLAQMLAMWLQYRPLLKKHKKILSTLLMPIIRKLVKLDAKFDKSQMFHGGSMITGISGVAYKEL
jgi:ubiquinone/menaquinone biosynthesis C-methylase UbiE